MHPKKNKNNLLALLFAGILFTNNFNINSMEFIKLQPGQVTQVDAYRQSEGGGCGYHAILNGIIIAKSLTNGSPLPITLDQNSYNEIFKKLKKLWADEVITNRIRTVLKYSIADMLLKNLILGKELCDYNPGSDCYALNLNNQWIKLKPDCQLIDSTYSQKEQKAICDIIINVAEKLVENTKIGVDETTYDGDNIFNQCCYENEEVFNIIKTELERRAILGNNPTYIQLYRQFKDANFKNTIGCCNFNFCLNIEVTNDNQVFNIDGDLYGINWQDRSKKIDINWRNKLKILNNMNLGDWLSSEEIDYLINDKIVNDKILSEASLIDPNARVFCLEGEIKDLFDLEDNLKQAAQDFKSNNYEGTAIFVIYHENHWFTCVVNKSKNELPKFIFADSLNIDRTKSDKAFELISALTDFN